MGACVCVCSLYVCARVYVNLNSIYLWFLIPRGIACFRLMVKWYGFIIFIKKEMNTHTDIPSFFVFLLFIHYQDLCIYRRVCSEFCLPSKKEALNMSHARSFDQSKGCRSGRKNFNTHRSVIYHTHAFICREIVYNYFLFHVSCIRTS